MPEQLDEKSEAKKAGYNTIADISKARIKKVIEKLRKEQEGKLDLEAESKHLLGFKAYKIAPSNFNIWRNDMEGKDALLSQLEIFTQTEKENSLHENMLHELILKSGRPLTSKIKRVIAGDGTVYNVNDNELHVFFDKLNDKIIATILASKPGTVVCLDSCFDKDETLTNFKLQLKDAKIGLTVI